MKEPIAVIQYTDGTDKTFNAYTADNMLSMIRHCIKNGLVYIVYLTKPYSIIPTHPSKPFKPHIAPLEYAGRLGVGKTLQGSFTEVAGTKMARHPPNRDEVLKKYQGSV